VRIEPCRPASYARIQARGDKQINKRLRLRGRAVHHDDSTVLLGFMLTPVIGFSGLAQLHRIESESWHVGSVRVELHDVPGEDAENDAVIGSRTDPAQGADRALRNGVWQGALDFIARRARRITVYLVVHLGCVEVRVSHPHS